MNSHFKKDASVFIGGNCDYYLDMWDRYAESLFFKGWNCSALLFGVLWVAYRRMYKEAAKLFGIQILAALVGFAPLLLTFLGWTPPNFLAYPIIIAANMATFAVFIYCGIFGNRMYKDKAERMIIGINEMQFEDTKQLFDTLENKGGTNGIIVLLFILVATIVIFVF